MSYDLGVLILRLVVGGLMIGHGTQKLFGWFGGHGLAVTSAFFGSQLRLRPAGFWTLLAGLVHAAGPEILEAESTLGTVCRTLRDDLEAVDPWLVPVKGGRTPAAKPSRSAPRLISPVRCWRCGPPERAAKW